MKLGKESGRLILETNEYNSNLFIDLYLLSVIHKVLLDI